MVRLASLPGWIRTLVNKAGSIAGNVDYDVFGNYRTRTGTTSRLGFTGEPHDANGLVYLRSQYLDPNSGRMLSADSVRPNAPGTQGYNAYSYVANNPTAWTDPSGHMTLEVGIEGDWVNIGGRGATLNLSPGLIPFALRVGCLKTDWCREPYLDYVSILLQGRAAIYGSGSLSGAVRRGSPFAATIGVQLVLLGCAMDAFTHWEIVDGNLTTVQVRGCFGHALRWLARSNAVDPGAPDRDNTEYSWAKLIEDAQQFLEDYPEVAIAAEGFLFRAIGSGGDVKGVGSGFQPTRGAVGRTVTRARPPTIPPTSPIATATTAATRSAAQGATRAAQNPVASSVAKPVAAQGRGGRAPVLQGQQGVNKVERFLTSNGFRVIRKEVTIEANGVRTRIDMLVETPQGKQVFVEVKNGPHAGLTENQKKAFPVIRRQGGIPRGSNAERAGLELGKNTGPMSVWVIRADGLP